MPKKAFVTGAAGFIGKHVVSALLVDGWEVTGYDVQQKPAHLDCAWVQASIMDVSSLERAMAGHHTVFHLAARAHLFARDPKVFDVINHQGTANVLNAALLCGVHHLIATLSAVALTPLNYTGKVNALEVRPDINTLAGPYAQSKWRADALLAQVPSQDLSVTRLYPTVPIGAGDDAFTAPTEMIRMFINNPPPAFLDAALNLVPVVDIAKAHVLAESRLDRAHTNAQRAYLIAGERWTLSQLLGFLSEHCAQTMPKRTIPYALAYAAATLSETWARLRGTDCLATREGVRLTTSDPVFETTQSRTSLGWTAGPVTAALVDTLEWLDDKQGMAPKA